MEKPSVGDDDRRAHSLSSESHVFILDPEGVFLVSSAGREQGAICGTALIGHNVAEVCPPEIAGPYLRHLERIRRSAHKVVFEHTSSNGESTTRFRTTFNPILDNGRLYAVGGVCRDITGLKGRLATHREAAKGDTLADSDTSLAFQAVDSRGRIVEVSRTWLHRLGYEREEVIGRPFRRFLAQESRVTDLKPDRAAHLTLLRKDGSALESIAHCHADPRDLLYCTLQDITGQKAAEERLRRSLASLAEVEYLSGIGHWEWDLRDDRRTWSQNMYLLFDRNPGDGPLELDEKAHLYGEKEAAFRDIAQKTLETGEPVETELEVTLADGRTSWHHGVVKADFDVDGKVTRVYGIVQDITRQKLLEKELRQGHALLVQRNQELEQKNLALQELIRGLREPAPAPPPAAGRAGVRIPRKLSALTPRELQVCLGIFKGMSSKEIAHQMGISPRSVETHRNHIRRKLRLGEKNLFIFLQNLLGRQSAGAPRARDVPPAVPRRSTDVPAWNGAFSSETDFSRHTPSATT